MKSKLRPSFVLILISSLLAFLSLPSLVLAQSDAVLSHLEFKRLSTLTGLPTDEVQKVYQDKDGLMWFATRYGFCHYDGYDVTLYSSFASSTCQF
ncbi:MAG: hypothetical protein EOM31_09795 [Bacteroidia bacterium]|nr:hypothetical protein [Bacteroidia bacterium]